MIRCDHGNAPWDCEQCELIETVYEMREEIEDLNLAIEHLEDENEVLRDRLATTTH